MPILPHVGRNNFSQLTARAIIYFLLIFGACGIVYPLLIVLGQCLSDKFDLRDNAIIPYYLRGDNELLLKYIYSHSPNSVSLLTSRHQRNKWASVSGMRNDNEFLKDSEELFKRQSLPLTNGQNIIKDLNEFKATLPVEDMLVKMFRLEDYYRPFLKNHYGEKADNLLRKISESGINPQWLKNTFPDRHEREKILQNKSELALASMNYELKSNYTNFYAVELLPAKNYFIPFWMQGSDAKERLWREFKKSLPSEQLMIIPSVAYWHNFLKSRYHLISNLNVSWSSNFTGFYEIAMPTAMSDDGGMLKDWNEFIRKRWPRRLLKVNGSYDLPWQDYVRNKLSSRNTNGVKATDSKLLTEVSQLTGKKTASWKELEFPATRPQNDTLGLYWCEFTSLDIVNIKDMEMLGPEQGFKDFLIKKYTSPEKLNSAWKTNFKTFSQVPLPLAYSDYYKVKSAPQALRWSFATESFQRVWGYLFGRGRAVWNTLVLVSLSLLSALTINPMAAYSLSRFPMRRTQKILIFFLATMAFPAEVAMIPNFLLLRDLGLLNTYAALILPGMANGFSIFLLKSFFDTLPQELYQAAEIDGASEMQIFRMVAMPLVAPILAYIGLGAFVAAYSGFLWALVICPQQEMWTLMVWVYDFQINKPGNNYVMAATTLVCIPPLVVFLFANRIIMRGIVIPSMK